MHSTTRCQTIGKFDRSVSLLSWAYNEEELIGEFLQRADKILDAAVMDYEIILVDDGSTDKTFAIAKDLQQKIPHLKIWQNGQNLNVAASLKNALREASKEYIFWQTVDWSYDIDNLRTFLEILKTHDIVQGVRRTPITGKGKRDKPLGVFQELFGWEHLTRRSDNIRKAIVSLINYVLIRALFRLPVSDYQNITFYPTKWVKSITLESNSSFSNPELLIKSYWHGFSIQEVPINFIPRSKGQAKGTKIKSIVKSIKDIFRLWFKWIILGKRGHITKGKVFRLTNATEDQIPS
jgi:glycosyltransferase involved in cell wall biosynthesis